MKIDIYNKNGKKISKKVTLSDDVFKIEPNDHSIYLAVQSEMAALRQGTHSSKSRSEVRGGAKIFHGSLINVSTMMLTIRVISIVELAAKNIVLRFSCEIFKLARVLKIKHGAPIKATISVICAVFTPPRDMRQK